MAKDLPGLLTAQEYKRRIAAQKAAGTWRGAEDIDQATLVALALPLLKAILDFLQPGTISSDLWDFLNPAHTEKRRMSAAERIMVAAKNPIYYKRWEAIGEDIKRRLKEEHPDLSFREAFRHRILANLPLGGIEALRVDFSTPPDVVLLILLQTLDSILPEDILGDDWRSEFIPELLSSPTKTIEDGGEDDDDAMTLGDTLISRERNPSDISTENQELKEAEEVIRAANLTKSEEEVFRIICDGGKPDDAAAALKMSPGSVRVHLTNARKKMRKALPKSD